MDNFACSERKRTERACDVLSSVSSDRSQGGLKSSIGSSVESFISEAKNSVVGFLDDLTEKSGNVITDIKRSMYFSPDNREDRRKSMIKRYRELYSYRLNSTCGQSTDFSENDEFASKEDSLIDEGSSKHRLPNFANQEKTHATLPIIQGNGKLPLTNLDNGFNAKPTYGNVVDNVQHWVSSNRLLSPQGIANENLKSNSDCLRRKFIQPVVNEEEFRKSDSNFFKTVHREELEYAFKLCTTKDHEIALSSHDSLGQTYRSEDMESIGNHCRTTRLPRESCTKKPTTQRRKSYSNALSKTCLNGVEQSLGGTRTVGTINITTDFLDKQNKLKLTIETLNILERDPCYTKDMSLLVKIRIVLRNKVEKKYSKVVKGKNIMFFNQDIFLKIKDPESATRPLFRLSVCKRRPLFFRKRYKPIAETSFYVNKPESGGRLEHSKLLTACV